jgi:hypothetical protein
MNLKLLLGIVVFAIGLIAAVAGIVGVADSEVREPAVMVERNLSMNWLDESAATALPWIAGLALALGGVLIGLSMGDFKHPRTHLEPGDAVVDPEGYHKMKHV